jgi:tetratricopeptide (TPR) repeat protein
MSARLAVLLSAVLMLVTLAVYHPVTGFDYVNFDDGPYARDNPRVREGLNPRGILWAFTGFEAANWHPLTWLSLMADVSLLGDGPGPHHALNLSLHLAASLLLLFLLTGLTGAVWPAFGTALLFAIHPLHVESVAWVAERKDVLSAFLFVLVLLAWRAYLRRPGVGNHLAVAGLFSLGLMAKPMLVTLPLVLLLLDHWPLGRSRQTSWWRLAWEKAPLAALAALSSWITLRAQARGGTVSRLTDLPPPARVANALQSALAYVMDALWPAGLAPLYPHPGPAVDPVAAGSSVGVLAVISWAVWRARGTRPHLLTGWLWYLGMLLPVIGLVQVGIQARADRYTYLPLIGLLLMGAWTAAWPGRRVHLRAAAAVTVLALGMAARVQVAHWRDSITLFTHTLAVTRENVLAHNNLGSALMGAGDLPGAIREFRRVLDLNPGNVDVRYNLALALERTGDPEGAEEQYRLVLLTRPDHARSHNNLGILSARRGAQDQAVGHYRLALQADPGHREAAYNLALALELSGRTREAEEEYHRALLLDPDNRDARRNLGRILLNRGLLAEAEEHLRQVVAGRPTSEAHNDLGIVLAREGRVAEALPHFRESLRLDGGNSGARVNLEKAMRLLEGSR